MKKEHFMAIYLLISSLIIGFLLTKTTSLGTISYGGLIRGTIIGAVIPFLITIFIFGVLQSLNKKGKIKKLHTISVAITAVVFVGLGFALITRN